MAFKLAEAFVRLSADDRDLRAGLGKADKETTAAVGRMKSAWGSIARIAFPAGIGIGLAAVARNAINTADDLSKLSQRTGVAVEALSNLRFAGELSGVTIERIADSLKYLNKNIVEASRGKETFAQAFDELGVAVTDSNGKVRDAQSVLVDLADVFRSMEDGTQKSAVAMKIFGESGERVIPLLNSNLRELNAQAERLGYTVSAETAKAAEEFNDRLTMVKLGSMGVANTIVSQTLPSLNAFGRYLGGQFASEVGKGESAVERLNRALGSTPDGSGDGKSWLRRRVDREVVWATQTLAVLKQLNAGAKALESSGRVLLRTAFSSDAATAGPDFTHLRKLKGIWEDLRATFRDARMEAANAWAQAIVGDVGGIGADATKAREQFGPTNVSDFVDSAATTGVEDLILALKLERAQVEGNAGAIAEYSRKLDELEAARMREAKVHPTVIQSWLEQREAIRAATAAVLAKAEADRRAEEAAARLAETGLRPMTQWEMLLSDAPGVVGGVSHEVGRFLDQLEASDAQLRKIFDRPPKPDRLTALFRSVSAEYQANMTTMERASLSMAMNAEYALSDLLLATFKGDLESAADAFKGFVNSILREITHLMAQRAIKAFLNLLLSTFGKSPAATSTSGAISLGDTSFFGVGSANGNLLRGGFQPFANGGVVRRPTLGLVGEGRYNEAVIPLPDGRSVPVDMRGAQEVVVPLTINFDPMGIADFLAPMVRQTPDEIGVMVGANLARNGKLRHVIRRKV